jgi:hypothetical protein
MTKYEDFVRSELQGRLAPGEPILHMAFLFNKSLAGMVLLGALGSLGEGYFLAAATDRRLFLLKTRMGLLTLKRENLGVVELPYQDIVDIKPGGALNQRTVGFAMRDGSTMSFRLNTMARFTAGQKSFLDSLPGYVAAWDGQRRAA